MASPKTKRFTDISIENDGTFSGSERGDRFSARYDLFLIHEAWDHGCDFELLADGFGPGFGTNGDWSAIRDSSPKAIEKMLEHALNHIFG